MTDTPASPGVSLSKEPAAPALPPAPEPAGAGQDQPVDAAAAEQPDVAQVEPAADAARPDRGGRLLVLAVVAVVTAALAAATLLLFRASRDADEVASYYAPSSPPLSAARTAGRVLFSYDHRTIDKDFADARVLTTGTFAKEYAQTTQAVVRPVAVESRAVVEATAAAQGIARAEPGEVVALVFLNQVTTSSKVTGQKLDVSRVRMTLVERDGRWLVSKVEAL